MKRNSIKYSLCILLLFSALCSLNAKEFRVLALSDISQYSELEMFDFEASEVIKVPINNKHASPKFEVPSNNVVKLYEKYPLDGAEVSPVLSMNFSGQSKDTLILLRNDPENENILKHKFIDCSPKSFPGGSLLVINSCTNPIMAKFGEKVVRFPPKNTKFVQLIDSDDDEAAPFSGIVKFAGPLNGQLDHFVSTLWYLPSTLKQIIILNQNRELGRYELRKVNIY